MTIRSLMTPILAVSLIGAATLAPTISQAQSKAQLDRRQQQKNQWRNLTIAAGAVGLYGLIKGDTKLAVIGAAGAAYSANRYEQDRKSQRRLEDRRYGYGYDSRDRYSYGNRSDYGYAYSSSRSDYGYTKAKTKKAKKHKSKKCK